MSQVNVESVKEFIKGMSLLDASKLVKALEEELGVSAAAPIGMMAAMPGAGGPGGAPVEEKTTFDVILAAVIDEKKKIQVIKVVRELTSLGLKEAKDLVEGAPKPVKEAVPKDAAGEMKKKLEEAGAKVELK